MGTDDTAEVSTEQGKLRLFVGIDRTSKFVFARLVESAGKMEAAQFLRDLVEAVPYALHAVLTDNGIQFTNRARDICGSRHIFDRVCDEHGIEHRLTKVNRPVRTEAWSDLNQRSGRTHEPHPQGCNRQSLASCTPTSGSSSMPTTTPAA